MDSLNKIEVTEESDQIRNGCVDENSQTDAGFGKKVWGELKNLAVETFHTSFELIKITVPAVIVVRILSEFGLIGYIGKILDPVMQLMGIPGEVGIVWATGMVTSLYGAMAVFAAMAPSLDLSILQVTVLCSILLIAHSLPVELVVSKRAGAPLWPIALLRLGGAVLYGTIFYHLGMAAGWYQEKAVCIFQVSEEGDSLLQWAYGQLINILLIISIICAIIILMRLLKRIGVLRLLENILNPVLPFFGMTNRAAPITVVGMIMGIGYGGALIIRETVKGKLEKKERINAMILMGLCHGLVEDTLCMMAIGGKLGGILLGRILFSLIVTFILVRLTQTFLHIQE